MSTELVRMPGGPIAHREEPTPMGLMQLAIEGKCDVGTLERLSALNEKYEAKKAKQAFDAALAAFQSECPIVLKSVNGAQGKYKFAPLDHIVSQVKPILEKHGFSYRLTSECGESRVKAIIKITHQQGHSEDSSFEVPIDGRNNLMNAAQQFGGAMTFAKRYAFTNAFGILTADSDTDGQGPQAKQGLKSLRGETTTLAGDAEVKTAKAELWAILAPVRGDQKDWKQAQQWLIDECLMDPDDQVSNLPANALRSIAVKAKGKIVNYE